MLASLRSRVRRSSPWRSVGTRFFMIKRLLLVCFLLALDVRDLVYKVVWLGAADSFSFQTGSVSFLEPTPVQSVVTEQMRRHGTVASGWSSFLSACDELYPFVSPGSKFFLSARLHDCRVRTNGTTTVLPGIVVISSARVDSFAWAACQLLFPARRPRICGDRMVVKFNERYMFDDISAETNAMAAPGSHAEAELLRFLDMVGLSYPLHKIVCVEGFTKQNVTNRGVFSPHIFACASPNLDRVEFVGVDAIAFKQLVRTKTWLTVDVLAFLGWRFGIRQNCASAYELVDASNGPTPSTLSIRAITAVNFSSHGVLYGLVVFIDLVLVTNHLCSIVELVKWMWHAQHYRLQLWIHHFDNARHDEDKQPTSAPVMPHPLSDESTSTTESRGHTAFDERALYSFFSTSFYRGWRYRVLIVATRVLSWLLIMPNSVIWTWSDSSNMKFQAYLGSIKSWVLVASTFAWLWQAVVTIREPLAYRISRKTHITNQAIIVIASLVALWQRDAIFTICEKKWQLERQRVNDLESFHGGYLAHGNVYDPTLEDTTTTPLRIAWIIFAPLVLIIVWSVVMICAWIAFKLVLSVFLRILIRSSQPDPAAFAAEPYKRLALEEMLESPIRALSIVRYQFSMEMVHDGQQYIRPSCYLDYGIMLKTTEYRKIVRLEDIFRYDPRTESAVPQARVEKVDLKRDT